MVAILIFWSVAGLLSSLEFEICFVALRKEDDFS